MAFPKSCMLFVSLLSLAIVGNAQSNISSTYTNPVLSNGGADPWVTRYGNYYYMTHTTNDNITILRSADLTSWDDADVKLAFNPPPGQDYSTDLWAPELQYDMISLQEIEEAQLMLIQ